ncbi:MAG: hypothetical protein WAO55_13275, partial [Candidatus Manganitrophaceae bacterium]
VDIIAIGHRERIYEETFRILNKENKQPSALSLIPSTALARLSDGRRTAARSGIPLGQTDHLTRSPNNRNKFLIPNS